MGKSNTPAKCRAAMTTAVVVGNTVVDADAVRADRNGARGEVRANAPSRHEWSGAADVTVKLLNWHDCERKADTSDVSFLASVFNGFDKLDGDARRALMLATAGNSEEQMRVCMDSIIENRLRLRARLLRLADRMSRADSHGRKAFNGKIRRAFKRAVENGVTENGVDLSAFRKVMDECAKLVNRRCHIVESYVNDGIVPSAKDLALFCNG